MASAGKWPFLVATACALTVGCERKPPAPHLDTSANASARAPASSAPSGLSSAASSAAPSEAASASWRDLVVNYRYKEALAAVRKLPEPAKARPDMRYLIATLAAETGFHKEVVQATRGLAKELPEFARSIGKMRLNALQEVGPYAEAAAILTERGGSTNQRKAGYVFLKLGKVKEAEAAFSKAIAQAGPKAPAKEAAARLARARLLQKAGKAKAAFEDVLWITRHAPGSGSYRAALKLKRQVAPKHESPPGQLYATAKRLSRQGAWVRALGILRRIEQKPHGVKRGRFEHLYGKALYRTKRYSQAAKVLDSARRHGSPEKIWDEFHAARALSRVDKDKEAVRRYGRLARKRPKSRWGREAAYLIGRLHMIHRHWKRAASTYRRFLKRYRSGRLRTAARYHLSLALLSGDRFSDAARSLKQLVKHAPSARKRNRYRQLYAYALMRAGRKKQAIAAFEKVRKDAPLSFAALMADVRLADMKVSVPAQLPLPAPNPDAKKSMALPKTVKMLRALGLFDEAEESLHRHARSFARGYAPNENQALCNAYGLLGRARRRYQVAQNHVKGSVLMQGPSLRTRWAWDCFYPQPFRPLVRAAEKREGLPRGLVFGLMRQESGFRPRVVSGARAVGLMQLLPSTGARLSKDLRLPFQTSDLKRPAVNIRLGSHYLSRLNKAWKGLLPLVIASYNAGPRAVSHWLQNTSEEPLELWVARIPYAETRGYVARVIGNWARYAYLNGDPLPNLPKSLPPGLSKTKVSYLGS